MNDGGSAYSFAVVRPLLPHSAGREAASSQAASPGICHICIRGAISPLITATNPPLVARADALPPVDYLATPQQSGVRLWGCEAQESSTPLPHSELQLPEGQGEESDLSAKGRKAFASSSSFAGDLVRSKWKALRDRYQIPTPRSGAAVQHHRIS
ncbi:Protein of unknown function [Gryllus bimaculatus]|nr:Protein of unknown function [Gryllus bimaculatus]